MAHWRAGTSHRLYNPGVRTHSELLADNKRLMEQLSNAGFADADPTHTPTYTFVNRPLLQLDHIMVADADAIAFERLMRPVGYDHFPIRATIRSI